MSETVEERLEEARRAVRRRSWEDACAAFLAVEADGVLEADSLESLGEAAWAAGRYEDAQRARERAYARYSDLGQQQAAARMALALCAELVPRGQVPAAHGWLAEAERLLADEPECAEHGRLTWIRSQLALLFEGDADASIELSGEVARIGRSVGDIDVEMLGLSTAGRALTRLGRLAEANKHFDAAMTAATSGRLRPHTAQIVYCHLLCSCSESQDYERGRSWSKVADSCCVREGIVPARGDCRVHRAGLERFYGDWAGAEEEARRGVEDYRDEMFHRGFALYELGELQLRRGDLPAAEQAFRSAEEAAASPQPGLALVKLAAGNAPAAASMISSALEEARDPASRASLLPAWVEIALAVDDREAARAAAVELAEIAAVFGTVPLQAAEATADGFVTLAEGDAVKATVILKDAVRRWQSAGAPYETARARLSLAHAQLASGDRQSAALELEAAQAAFERLGATRQAHAATSALQQFTGSSSEGAGAHTTKTFAFTDIVDSSALIALIGDEAWVHLLRWHDATLRKIFATHGGEEVDHAGDGFFVAFASELDAINCAVEIQRSLAQHREQNGFAPHVRIGIHAADARMTGGNYQGAGVHVAARIGGAARGGEILASRTTAEAAPIAATDLRTLSLKGIPQPVEVATVAWHD